MDFYDSKFYKDKEEYLDFNFKIERKGHKFSLVHRVALSRDKKKYFSGDYRPATYKAYKDYLSSLEDESKAIDYPSYKRFIAYMSYKICMQVIHNQKSFKIPFIGILSTYKRKNKKDIIDKTGKKTAYNLSLKFDRNVSNYIKRYNFNPNRFYKKLLEFLVRQENEDWFRESYHFIKTKI